MDVHSPILEKVNASDYKFDELLEGAGVDQVAEFICFCFLNTAAVDSIVVNNFAAVSKLDKEHWRNFVAAAVAKDEYYIESFLTLLQIHCRIDQGYLRDLGVPEDRIERLIEVVGDAGFPYDLYKEATGLSRVRQLMRDQKLKGLREQGLSETEMRALYNLFTDPKNWSSTENPMLVAPVQDTISKD